ncbi:hypothetical protein M885DRAFT_529497, partial [Pelagophyceae sp. CCMP2097]
MARRGTGANATPRLLRGCSEAARATFVSCWHAGWHADRADCSRCAASSRVYRLGGLFFFSRSIVPCRRWRQGRHLHVRCRRSASGFAGVSSGRGRFPRPASRPAGWRQQPQLLLLSRERGRVAAEAAGTHSFGLLSFLKKAA